MPLSWFDLVSWLVQAVGVAASIVAFAGVPIWHQVTHVRRGRAHVLPCVYCARRWMRGTL